MNSRVLKGLNGIEVDVRTQHDPNHGVVHVLDLARRGSPSVTNSIERLQPQIIDALGLDGGVSSYQWLLYGTDGVISKFEQGTFTFVSGDDPRVHTDFRQAMVK